MYFKKCEKKSEKSAKFLKNSFLVLSKESRTKLKDSRKNQNQMFFEIRNQTQLKHQSQQ